MNKATVILALSIALTLGAQGSAQAGGVWGPEGAVGETIMSGVLYGCTNDRIVKFQVHMTMSSYVSRQDVAFRVDYWTGWGWQTAKYLPPTTLPTGYYDGYRLRLDLYTPDTPWLLGPGTHYFKTTYWWYYLGQWWSNEQQTSVYCR